MGYCLILTFRTIGRKVGSGYNWFIVLIVLPTMLILLSLLLYSMVVLVVEVKRGTIMSSETYYER